MRMIRQIFPQGPRSIMGTTLKILIAKSRVRFAAWRSELTGIISIFYFLFYELCPQEIKKKSTEDMKILKIQT